MQPQQVYASESSHVWTGALGTSVDAIESAEQHEIESLPFGLHIWLKNALNQASVAAPSSAQQESGLYLVQSRPVHAPCPPQHCCIFLPSDAMSCFSIYSPSPFVSSVLVVLNVGEIQQVGYFFGRLRHAVVTSAFTEKKQLRDDRSARWETDVAEELLAALHTAFPAVKLSSLAQKCLARQGMSRRVAGKYTGGSTKRRKTLSADAFYGSKTVKEVVTEPVNDRMGDKSWRAFYKKLQFRVSHSVMCQREGTAAISMSFPRQQEAFEFADQVAALRRRMESNHSASPDSGHHEMDCMPRVFSFESAGDGKRRFLVTSLVEFWKKYTETRASQRHVYEIIREGVPCRLYLDLEFKRVVNLHVDGNALVTRLLSLFQLQFYRRYGIHVRRQDIYQLESSTPSKFSRHVIFHLPGGDLFEDNRHAGAFVRELINDLVVPIDDEGSERECLSQVCSPFFVNTESANDAEGKRQLFIDTGVYTRNRMFRVLGSSKFKKQAVLRLLNASSASSLTELDRRLFLNTLVCPFESIEAVRSSQKTKPFRLLRCERSPAVAGRSRGLASSSAHSLGASVVECRSSIYPVLDVFILSKATTGGVQGEIRAVQMLWSSSSNMLAALPNDESCPEQPDANTPSRPWMIIYHMTRNRWCANIRRPHKSNNIMFVVNIDQRVFYQKCHDPTCQSMDYRSPSQPLPLHMNFGVRAVKASI